ncbi:MAG: hypothetical protein DHS20C16_32340 [Phycisphaerae bacterium]|nr:MAG: hypothetical protein DHS20C16_32340 [Phycisphaerae bacterium]
MIERMMSKMARFAAVSVCLVGFSLASTGCEEHKHEMGQTKQCCGKDGKCCKPAAKKCGADCKKACCKSGKKCGADCSKACCKTAKKCGASCTKPCCKKA